MEVQQIPLSEIQLDPTQPRKSFCEKRLQLLSENIAEMGVLQPITVMPSENGHVIVMGERRFRASKMAKLQTIPCIVREFDKDTKSEVQIVENLQREDVEPLEEAEAILFLAGKYSPVEIGKRIGRTSKFVHSRLKLAQLSEHFKPFVKTGDMPLITAVQLATMPLDEQEQLHELLEGRFDKWRVESFLKDQSQDLANAPFDPSDKELYPSAGACTTCPFNSANTGNLFGDDKHICTKNPCFRAKSELFLKRILEDCKKENILVVAEHSDYAKDWEDNVHFRSLLQSQGLKEYYHMDSVRIIRKPEQPTMEKLLEEYPNHDWEEGEAENDLKELLEQYSEDLARYEAAIEKGCRTAILMDTKTFKYKSVLVALREKKTGTTDVSEDISKKKMDECTDAEKILKIEQRAERKEQIERNKEFVELYDAVKDGDYATQTKALSKEEMTAFCITLYENVISWHKKKLIKNFYPKMKNTSPEQLTAKFQERFDKKKFHQMARILIQSNLHFGENNHDNNMTNHSFYKAVMPFHKEAFQTIESEYADRKKLRLERTKERIDQLKD
ncbi:ParB/RepB/Spo0J family partition protein [Flavobacterium sp. ASW18X]|uniref:ParB/RepB/Spo0J family partition protein n=1 Tax=Flavobacterium sp. ASW18X TaxID=2572595 RepID=UPI0010AE636F|nr:ParB/RepB/Spo0J family partition protein [Flavobacterium sp. ASW18X]TKD59026.1 ParB/RepB/Spo0J family partition protein [Flavobacterium sp. ASW18X]